MEHTKMSHFSTHYNKENRSQFLLPYIFMQHSIFKSYTVNCIRIRKYQIHAPLFHVRTIERNRQFANACGNDACFIKIDLNLMLAVV